MAIERQAANMLLSRRRNTGFSDNPPRRMDEGAYYTHSQLRDRGWTGKWIKRFSADMIVRYAGAICFCRFWDRLKIQEIECSQEWQAYRRAMDAEIHDDRPSGLGKRDGDSLSNSRSCAP